MAAMNGQPAHEPATSNVAGNDGTAPGGAVVRLEHVTKRYGAGPPAVDDLSLSVPAGEICVLVGPSGCGKTTTMKMINRLIEPTSGTITIDGEDVTKLPAVELRRRIGYVIQQVGLFPHLTVGDNVGVVPRLLRWKSSRIAERTDELLELVGLDPAGYRDRYPSELSGGERQRIGVARAVAGGGELGYALVVDGEERPLGWIDEGDIAGDGTVDPASATPGAPTVQPETTLRDALSAMLGSSVQLGVVVDERDRVIGLISVDAISEVLRAPVRGADGALREVGAAAS